VQEEFRVIYARLIFDLASKIERRRFAEQGLAAAGRSIKEEPFRHVMLKALEEVLVQKR